ncbi:MAG: carboxypeptidase-like regulatory domain-containing protein, partial [Terriglobales bacterium]
MDLARALIFIKLWASLSAFACLVAFPNPLIAHESPASGSARRIPGHPPSNVASLQGTIRDAKTKLAIPGVKVSLLRTGIVVAEKWTDAEGIFRLLGMPLGTYELKAEKPGFQALDISAIRIDGGETEDLALEPIAGGTPMTKGPSGIPGAVISPTAPAPEPTGPYPGLRTHQIPGPLGIAPEQLPPDSANFSKEPDRWNAPMPEW